MSISDLANSAMKTLSDTARAVSTRATTAYLILPLLLNPSLADAHPAEGAHVHYPEQVLQGTRVAVASIFLLAAIGATRELLRERREYETDIDQFVETGHGSPKDARESLITGQVFYGIMGGASAIYSAVLAISAMQHQI